MDLAKCIDIENQNWLEIVLIAANSANSTNILQVPNSSKYYFKKKNTVTYWRNNIRIIYRYKEMLFIKHVGLTG